MKKAILFNFEVDKENKQIKVERSFNAPVDMVWAAWTQSEILDQWWAPKPWVAQTKSMDFREGGQWLYAMVGPQGEKHWSRADYIKIEPEKLFSSEDIFCDENGHPDESMPSNNWENRFTDQGETTLVNILLRFKKLEDLEATVNMGFKEGFTTGLKNLDEWIETQLSKKTDKSNTTSLRVSTYLNFPGNTEEAFNFYKKVFRSEFVNGFKRFGELPVDPNQPPIPESVKNLVLHVQLPIIGGHVLMGSDAPTEFGMTVNRGNNMYLNLEAESKEEATRLFEELSAEGKIEMPLQDTFWGAFFGSFQDRFGINWMINYQKPS